MRLFHNHSCYYRPNCPLCWAKLLIRVFVIRVKGCKPE